MSDLHIDQELTRLPVDDHLEVWAATQGRGAIQQQIRIAKRFGISVYAVGKIVSGINTTMDDFVTACGHDNWATLAQLARDEMACWRLDQFGFGETPKLKADKLFLSRIVDPAGELVHAGYTFRECSRFEVRRLWELADWVTTTREATLRTKELGRARVRAAFMNDLEIFKVFPDRRWERVQKKLGLQKRSLRKRRS